MSTAQRIKKFIRQSKRVLKVTKKPGPEEYKTITQVSLLGIAVLGVIGFALYALSQPGIAGELITTLIAAAITAYLILMD